MKNVLTIRFDCLQHSLELDMPEEKRIRLGDFEFSICTRKDEDQESVYSWQSYETGKL
jgi:hypothetical protein